MLKDVTDTQIYWVIVSKRKGKLWRGTKDDWYSEIFMTKEDAEDTLTIVDLRYYKAVQVEMKILENNL
jgi:hypothetical protein